MTNTLRIGRYGRSIFVLGLALAFVALAQGSAWAADDPPPTQFVFMPAVLQERIQQPPDPNAPLCRYGVAASGDVQYSWLPTWRAGWTLDFGTRAPKPSIAAEYYQMVHVSQKKAGCDYLDGYTTSPALTEAGLGNLIRSAPGSIWIVGNEPDRGPNPENCRVRVQGDTYPEVYAEAYHDVYDFIKQRDPHALVAIAGLVEVTPGRLQYLDKMWQAYQKRYQDNMPVDIWNMHLYILPETFLDGRPNGVASVAVGTDPALGIRESGGDPARCADPQVYCFAEHDDLGIFAEQIVAMRTWMKQHGQQNRPLILSEYSQLYPYEIDPQGCFLQDEFGNCFTPERVSSFMSRSFAYLETAADPNLGYPLDNNHLIQRWLWFSANRIVGTGRVSNLLVDTLDRLTLPGQTFQGEVMRRDAYINFRLGQVSGYSGYVRGPGQTATVTLFADVLNNGSVDATSPITATFYADSALTRPIMVVPVSAPVKGCAWQPLRVYATWSDLSVGVHSFWVRIDDGNAVGESDETDNISASSVTVYRYGTMLPMVFRW